VEATILNCDAVTFKSKEFDPNLPYALRELNRSSVE